MPADIELTTGEDAVAILMNDHARIKALFEELLNGDGTTRSRTIEELKPLLVIHNATEENLIYPVIHSIVQRPQHARGLYHQQDDAEVAFFELGQCDGGDPEFVRLASDLLDKLLAHVKEEETSEFLRLREALAPAAMVKLTAEVREFRETFGAEARSSRHMSS